MHGASLDIWDEPQQLNAPPQNTQSSRDTHMQLVRQNTSGQHPMAPKYQQGQRDFMEPQHSYLQAPGTSYNQQAYPPQPPQRVANQNQYYHYSQPQAQQPQTQPQAQYYSQGIHPGNSSRELPGNPGILRNSPDSTYYQQPQTPKNPENPPNLQDPSYYQQYATRSQQYLQSPQSMGYPVHGSSGEVSQPKFPENSMERHGVRFTAAAAAPTAAQSPVAPEINKEQAKIAPVVTNSEATVGSGGDTGNRDEIPVIKINEIYSTNVPFWVSCFDIDYQVIWRWLLIILLFGIFFQLIKLNNNYDNYNK